MKPDELDHSPFIHCTKLEKLWLKAGPKAKDLKAIGRLGSLQELFICDQKSDILDKDFQDAFEQQQLLSLQRLDIMAYSHFGKRAVQALLKYCPNLIEWSCSGIGEIKGLEESVTDCGTQRIKLQKLKFEYCTLTRNTMMAVANLSNLKELHVQGCEHKPLPLAKCDYRDAFQPWMGNLFNLKVLKRCDDLDKEGSRALLQDKVNWEFWITLYDKEYFYFYHCLRDCLDDSDRL
jgi:hypothetical protein